MDKKNITSRLSQEQLDEILFEADKLNQDYELDCIDENTNVIWQPQAGSQQWFLSCSCYEALLSGPRGTGKTDVLLMDFARDCGVGWGSYWFGMIFRKTYRELTDVVAKSRRWYPRIFPGIKFNQSNLTWVWPTGERLMLSYMDTIQDYQSVHGFEIPFCVSYDTKVKMADGTSKPICDIKIGEQVLTLEGPKPVLNVIHSYKNAVEASFFDDHSQLLGSQIQGEGHRILSAYGMHNGCSLDSLNAIRLSCDNQESWLDYKSLQDYHLHSIEVFSLEQSQRMNHQLDLLFAIGLYYGKSLSCLFQIFLQFLISQHFCKMNIQSHNLFSKNEGNFFSRIGDYTFLPKEVLADNQELRQLLLYGIQFFLMRLSLLRQKMAASVLGCEFPCDHDEKLIQGSLLNHFFYYDHSDGQFHQDLKSDQDISPLFSEISIPILNLLCTDEEGILHNNNEYPNFYKHPYSKELRRSNLNYSSVLASCKFTPLNKKVHLVDLTIADASHYITDLNQSQLVSSYGSRSVVNSNCGFEELTNWGDEECYESVKTCCRSSCPITINGRSLPKRIRATTNPYGKGHSWVKKYFISAADDLVIVKNNAGQERVWINSKLSENKKLIEADPQYVNTLSSIKDPNKRKAWFEGSWDIVSGGIIGDLWDSKTHVIEPFEIPKKWRIDRAFDWGTTSPFTVGWFAESDGSEVEIAPGKVRYFPKGSIILIHEWYGWTGEENTGLNLPAAEVAKKIMQIEKEYSLLKDRSVLPGPADNSIFNNTDAETTIASRMQRLMFGKTPQQGVTWKRSNKSPGSRISGLTIFRDMVAESLKPNPEEACFYVFNTCREGFLRTVPNMQRDDKNPDDAYGGGEDHSWDMVRYRVLSRYAVSKRQEI